MTNNEAPVRADSGSDAPATLSGEEASPFANLDLQPEEGKAAPDTDEHRQTATESAQLDLVLDIPVRLSVELGRTQIPVRDVVNLGRGSMIELDSTPGAPLDVRVNGVLIGRGEIVVVDEERLALRFVEVASQKEKDGRPR